ncbi:DUF2567 domain-containing protein [Streptomyces antimicrobicus]|uniref:DUF2567 domain-containing protein n=1 Tax=Streptomyces antimicrobicus TaxID=2883108 RepID=A0ABS8B3Z6_9ACTN|nr:DUF2567 domain-containing protein [Streptomyces antimicrobicus]MCB5179347.1 DUF2567 domain-containing protein [Streptomyces antimicrobicus]
MTEAVTPPQPSPAAPEPTPEQNPGRITAADVRDGAAVALAVGVCGLLLGVLWAWLAPRMRFVSNGQAVFLADTESEARIGADGTFLLLGAGLGLLSAVAVFLWRRRGGVPLVVGLALGSVFASLLGWRLGMRLGPSRDLAAAAAEAGKGVPFDAPLQLLAYGVLLAWPMVAVAAHLAMTALWTPRDPAPGHELPPYGAGYPPPHVHGGPVPADSEPPR